MESQAESDVAALEAATKALLQAKQDHAQLQALLDATALETLYPPSAFEPNHQTQVFHAAPPKYRGKPPVDPDQLPSHEAFIEALTPISIDSIIENDRKCPHCWRIYGDPDPGEDNAEEPVRLPCGHEFGEQCALRLFQLPEAVKVDLHPLSYEDGYHGEDLGRRLAQYVQDESSKSTKTKPINSSTKRLLPSLRSSARLKGKAPGVNDPTPAEDAVKNALIELLTDIRKPIKGHRTAQEILGSEWYNIFEAALTQNQALQSVHFLENAIIYDVNIESPSPYFPDDYPPSFYYPGDFGSSTTAAPPEAFMPSSTFIPHPELNAASSHVTPTSSSENPNKDFAQEKAAIVTAVAKLQDQLHSLDKLVKDDSGPAQTTDLLKSMEDFKSEMLELNSKADKVTSKLSSPSSSTFSSSSSVAATLGTPSTKPSATALNLASSVSASRRNRQEEAQKRAEETMRVLASALVEVYKEYRKRHRGQVQSSSLRASSSSPPLKKQKPSTMTTLIGDIVRKQLNINVRVHTNGLKTKHYEIMQPRSSFDDYSDDEDEDQVPGEQDEASFYIMKRSLCNRTCCVKDRKSRAATKLQSKAEVPTSIGWRDIKSVPNDCPKCRRLLFKMNRTSPNGESEGITAMHTYNY